MNDLSRQKALDKALKEEAMRELKLIERHLGYKLPVVHGAVDDRPPRHRQGEYCPVILVGDKYVRDPYWRHNLPCRRR